MLRVLIVVLAVADGIIHLALNFVLFRGNFWGPLPFPSPLPLPLNQLFTLNFIGYIVLAICFWFGTQFLGARRWLIDVAIMIFALLSIIGWVQVGMPNPMGLGYLSKALEVALIVALAVDAWRVLHSPSLEERTA